MRHYEIMLLIHPDQSERARVMMDRYVGIIEGGQGQVHRNEDLGRRMLAYPIAKVQKAHYMLMNVECGQETLDELVGALHFSDAVLRHLVIRCDEAVTDQSVLARAAEKEAARENREYPYDREVAHERRAARDESSEAKTEDGEAAATAEPEQSEAAQEDAGGSAAAVEEEQPEEEQPEEEADASAGEAAKAGDDEPAVAAESGTADQADEDAATEDAAGSDEDSAPEDAAGPGEDEAKDDGAVQEDDAAADEDGDPKEKKE